MVTSENIDQLVAAMALARKDFSQVKKNQQNKFLGNKYADQAAIYEATTEALSANGLVLMSGSESLEHDIILVTTYLAHSSGQWVSTSISVPIIEEKGTNRLQAIGRSVAYGVRYNTGPLLAVAAEDDGDGQSQTQDDKKGAPTVEAHAPAAPKERPPRESHASIESQLAQELKRLVGGRTDDVARQELIDLYQDVWGTGVDTWAKVTSLPLDVKRRGVIRLGAMVRPVPPAGSIQPFSASKAVPPAASDLPPPETPHVGKDGYVEPHDVDALAMYADLHGVKEILDDLWKACPGYPNAPQVTPTQYVGAVNAVQWQLKAAERAEGN